jgi:hypothetical protein
MTLYRVQYRPRNKEYVVIDWLVELCLECRPEAMFKGTDQNVVST